MNKKKTLLFISFVLVGIILLSTGLVIWKNCKKEEDTMPKIIIGVSWDRTSESTKLSRLTTNNDNTVNTDITNSPVAGIGNISGSSPFDNYYPWNAMKEYNVINNEIAYSSDDEEFSRTKYDTVVYIPTFYYKVVDSKTTRKFYISSQPEEGFEVHPGSNNYVAKYNTSSNYTSVSGVKPVTNVTRDRVRVNARIKGDNWSQYDFATWNAIQMLYLVEYADWNVQATIGRGIVDEESTEEYKPIHLTGETDSMAYHTGRAKGVDGLTQVQYRYIEGLWGNVCEWIDGINVNDGVTYISLDYATYDDDTTEGYTATGVTLPETGKIKDVGHSSVYPWAFIPDTSIKSTDYSNSTYIPDKICSYTGWRVVYTSNNYSGDNLAGLFRFGASSLSDRVVESYGCRLVYHGN